MREVIFFFLNFTSLFVFIPFFWFEFFNRMLLTQETENGKREIEIWEQNLILTLSLFTHHK